MPANVSSLCIVEMGARGIIICSTDLICDLRFLSSFSSASHYCIEGATSASGAQLYLNIGLQNGGEPTWKFEFEFDSHFAIVVFVVLD